jgi:L,D-peptidoglycan transpeptidase YkuD (ErfK/YbiS/YcfS/YnhG family)
MRKLPIALALAALLAAGVVVAAHAEAATLPPYHPTRLAHVGDAQQLIVVTGVSLTSTYASVHTYQKKADGSWTQNLPAMPARIGYGGWVTGSKRRQDTGTTPAGTYTLTDAFGLLANPGAKLPYRHADSNDYWVGDNRDAQTYNLVQPSASAHRTWRTSEAERLAAYPTQYQYAVVIDYNRPNPSHVTWNEALGEHVAAWPANVKLGSAIFLHVSGAGSTAGCVSIPKANLVSVLKWLDPAQHPRIVMAPLSQIGKA